MKQQANLIRAGQVIEHGGRRWTVLKQQIITPGKGGAFIQVEMRDLKTGNKTNERWRTADTVERYHQQGLVVGVWTVNSLLRKQEVAAWGVERIITDCP